MLSYRHGFHAGNHADVIKHLVLVACLEYLAKKDKGFFYLDTHAGAGLYDLRHAWAQKNAEYRRGAELIYRAELKAPLLLHYQQLLRDFNEDDSQSLHFYPGSAAIALKLLRKQDSGRFAELQDTESAALAQLIAADRRFKLERSDGFALMKSLLPPVQRRGLVLIDPPYEVKSDYDHVLTALNEAHRRFANGVYLLWYPLLAGSSRGQQLQRACKRLPFTEQLHVQLQVAHESASGMYGSALAVINPPWQLAEQLQACRPELESLLSPAHETVRLHIEALV